MVDPDQIISMIESLGFGAKILSLDGGNSESGKVNLEVHNNCCVFLLNMKTPTHMYSISFPFLFPPSLSLPPSSPSLPPSPPLSLPPSPLLSLPLPPSLPPSPPLSLLLLSPPPPPPSPLLSLPPSPLLSIPLLFTSPLLSLPLLFPPLLLTSPSLSLISVGDWYDLFFLCSSH